MKISHKLPIVGLLCLQVPLISSLSISTTHRRSQTHLCQQSTPLDDVCVVQPSSDDDISTSSPHRRNLFKSILLASIASVATRSNARASTTDDVKMDTETLRKIYDENASTYDVRYSESLVSQQLQFTTLRRNLLSNVRGDVLELGVGTGLNLPHYPSNLQAMTSYSAIDLSPNMMNLAKGRFSSSDPKIISPSLLSLYDQKKVNFDIGDVGKLTSLYRTSSSDDTSSQRQFDTILDTFGLCVFPEPLQVLKEAHAMLEPTNGQLLLIEHQDSLVGKVLSPSRKLSDVSSTCRYDDDVEALVKEAGFSRVQKRDLKGGFLVEIIAKV